MAKRVFTTGQVPTAEDFNALAQDADLQVPGTSGAGIKVDLEAPTYGWRDLTSDIQVRGTGAADPTFAVYTGTTLRGYSFSATVLQEVFMVFHVPHDYLPGSAIHFHAHWSNAEATPNTGSVVFGFDYSFAKGFSQEPFAASTIVRVTQACPAIRYTHNVAETAAVAITGLEVDGLVLVRAFRDAAHVSDTCTDAVFLHTVDIHYQSTNMATKNKSPSFYGAT
jgi:hypothetical protein